jgi:PHS family inorganic phosphate transporter-like MFS transporter
MWAFFAIIGLLYNELTVEHQYIFIIMYGMTFFFSNFGPNVTTYLIPAAIYPTNLKSTANGFSAAAEKIGAIIGSFAFKPMFAFSPRYTFIICSGVSLMGLILTWFCIPNVDNTEEGLEIKNHLTDEESGNHLNPLISDDEL